MSKRLVLMVGLLLTGALAFATGTQEGAAAAEGGELTIWHGSIHPGLTALVEKFNEDNPEVELVYEAVPFKEYAQKVIAASRTGTLPDMLVLQPKQPAAWGKLGYIRPVEDLIEKLESSGYEFSDLDKQYNTADGHVWGVPFWSIPHIMFGREDWLADAGFDGIPEDWDSFREAAAKLTVGDERYAYAAFFADPSVGHFTHQWMAARGADTFGPDLELIIDSPETHDVLQLIGDLYERGFINKGATSSDMGEARLFYRNEGAALISTSTSFGNTLGQAPELLEKTISSTMPNAGGEGNYYAFTSLSITKESENQELAEKAAEYFFHPDNYQVFFENTIGHMPAEITFVESGRYWDLPNIAPAAHILRPGSKAAQSGWFPGMKHEINEFPALFDAQNIYQDMILKVVTEGASPEEAARWAEEQMRLVMENR